MRTRAHQQTGGRHEIIDDFGARGSCTAFIPAPRSRCAQSAEKIYEELAALPAAERQKRLEDGARKEGRLVLIHTMRGKPEHQSRRAVPKRYPFLNVSLEGDIGSQDAAERLYAEETAGRHLTDLINVALPDLTTLTAKDMIARFPMPAIDKVLPPYQGIHRHGRPLDAVVLERARHLVQFESRAEGQGADRHGWISAIRSSRAACRSIPAEERYLSGLYAIMGEEADPQAARCVGANDPIIQRGHTQRIELMLAGDHMVQGDNYLYHGISVKRKNPSAPYAISYSVPVMGFAGVAAINKNTTRPHAAALWTDWTLSEESQKYVATLLRGTGRAQASLSARRRQDRHLHRCAADVSKRLLGHLEPIRRQAESQRGVRS